MNKHVVAKLIEPGDLDDHKPGPELGLRAWKRLRDAVENGFWFCRDCKQSTERIEGEQGQPAHCERCGSYRIHYHKPALN